MMITQHGSALMYLVSSETSEAVYFVDLADKGDGSKRGKCDCWPGIRNQDRNRRDGLGRQCKHLRAARKHLAKRIASGEFDALLKTK